MADYVCSARTNYFLVKDPISFDKAMETLKDDIRIGERAEDGRLCLYCLDPQGWPTYRYDAATGEEDREFSIYDLVSQHLADEEVAIFLEVGAERLRYVRGYGVALNNRGERREVNLSGAINELASELGSHVTWPEG